ncbi:MAG TPA: TolC family protein [Thermoanaerobaculia bacterium]|jgi:outer membrane protein TolC|nr:TolC family protein [Thermoanaerobaculia bacterium]
MNRWSLGALLALAAAAAAAGQAPPALQPSPPSAAPAPLTLGRAAELALANAPEVAAAAAAWQGDQAGARLAADAFRPAAEVSSTPGVGRGLPVAVAGRVPAVVSVDLRQSLYNTEQRAQGLQARARSATTRAAWERARVQVAREIADLYARCWTGQQLLAGAERRLAAYQAMTGRAAALHAEARATDLDLAQARLREAKARLRRLEIAAARDADLWELRRRLGLAADAPLALPEDPLQGTPEPAGGGLGAAPAADPDLAAAARSIELLERAIRLRHGILSQVTLDADAQYSRLSRANGIDQFYVKFREDDWSVAVAVTVPLWSGGRLRDAGAQAAAELDRQKQQRRAREEQLEIEVHRAAATLDQAQGAADLARQSAAVAEEDLRIAEALAAEGRAEPDALDSRQAALADAREEEIKATASLLNARVQLLAVRGELLGRLGLGGPG